MRVLVCGPADWTDADTVKMVLNGALPDEVIHNDSATGVDAAAAQWCAENSVPDIVVPVDGTKGASAEQLNIEAMLALSPELVMSFTFMDPDDPEAIPTLLATDMAAEAGIAIDFSILDLRPTLADVPEAFTCTLCGRNIVQVFNGDTEPLWADLNGDPVCTGSTEARPDHIPALLVEDPNPQPPVMV